MKRLFCVFFLTSLVNMLNAQHFVDNLFVRYPWSKLGAVIDKGSIKKLQLVEKQSTPYGEKY